MIKKLMLTAICLGFAASLAPEETAAQDRQILTIIHALPPLPDAVPSSNPVDVAFDDKCQHTKKPYGSRLGPAFVEAKSRTFYFYEANPSRPCNGTVLAVLATDEPADAEFDVVLHLDAEGEVTASVWRNEDLLDAVDVRTGKAAVQFRNAGAGSPLEGVIQQGGNEQSTGETEDEWIPPGGTHDPIQTDRGRYRTQVFKGDNIVSQTDGRLRRKRAYWIYITGATFRNNIDQLVYESVLNEQIEGDLRPPPEPAFSACCSTIGSPSVCSQISVANCQQSLGRYIGNVSCTPNPC